MNRILFPIDYSECSEAAFDAAVTFAERLDATLVLLHAYDLPDYLPPGIMVVAPGSRTGPLLDEIERRAREELDLFLARHEPPAGLSIERRLVHGAPARSIVHEAEREPTSLIVMGTTGRTGLHRWMLGSVAERVVRQTHCPVLTVRCPATRRANAPQ